MERIFVTGGSGFIGGHLIKALLAMGYQVTNYDKKPSMINPGASHIIGDICDFELLRNAMRGNTIVCHLAAMVGVVDCNQHVEQVVRNNYDGVKNILQACRENRVTRIVYASSSEVYGEGAGRDKLRETDTLSPISVYGKTKASSEELLREFSMQENIQATALRYCNIYGARQRPEFVVPIFIRCALQNQPLLVCNGGKQIRNYTYIDDAVRGTIAAMFRYGMNYEVYNICSEFSLSVQQLAEKILLLNNNKGSCKAITYEEAGRQADNEIECRTPSGEKAYAELNVTARTTPDEGLAQCFEYYRKSLEPIV